MSLPIGLRYLRNRNIVYDSVNIITVLAQLSSLVLAHDPPYTNTNTHSLSRWTEKYGLNLLLENHQMAEVCLDVVDVKTHRSMGGNVYSCVQGAGVWGGLLENQRKKKS